MSHKCRTLQSSQRIVKTIFPRCSSLFSQRYYSQNKEILHKHRGHSKSNHGTCKERVMWTLKGYLTAPTFPHTQPWQLSPVEGSLGQIHYSTISLLIRGVPASHTTSAVGHNYSWYIKGTISTHYITTGGAKM